MNHYGIEKECVILNNMHFFFLKNVQNTEIKTIKKIVYRKVKIKILFLQIMSLKLAYYIHDLLLNRTKKNHTYCVDNGNFLKRTKTKNYIKLIHIFK